MACNIISDLILLELPCVNLIVNDVGNDELYNVMFHSSENRIQLLCGILNHIDNDLQEYFESLKTWEERHKELIEMYTSLHLIEESEKSFIAGDMEISNQCSVWLRIISCLKNLARYNSCDLDNKSREFLNCFKKSVEDPDIKMFFSYDINSENKEVSSTSVVKNSVLTELEEIDRNIKNLETTLADISELEGDEKLVLSLKGVNSKHNDLEHLIDEWSRSLQKWWRMHEYEIREHHSQHSSGYESFSLNSTSVLREPALEESVNVDLTENVYSLYNNCKNIFEFISTLKEIKMEAENIFSRPEGSTDTSKVVTLQSFLCLLHKN